MNDDDQFVCTNCIGDAVLQAEIENTNTLEICSFCGDERKCIALNSLADRVDTVYREIVGQAEYQPVFYEDSDKVGSEQDGQTPEEITSEMLECDEEVAEQIVQILSIKYQWDVVKDGDYDWYDSGSHEYKIRVPPDEHYVRRWDDFKRSAMYERRFFNRSAQDVLDELIGAALQGNKPELSGMIRSLGASSESKTYIYRARVTRTDAEVEAICLNPATELGVPPARLRRPGRMNPAGVAVLYGALAPETCVAEVRAPVGATVVTGRFEVMRPLRLLDLTTDIRPVVGSYFDPDLARKFAHLRFLSDFGEEVSQPILPDDELLGYLPTQFVAEYLASVINPRFDGLIFRSAQTPGAAPNIALFEHACSVEDQVMAGDDADFGGFNLEEDGYAFVRVQSLPPSGAFGADTDMSVDIWTPEHLRKRQQAGDSASVSGPQPSMVPPPPLRIDRSGMSILRVRAVFYKTARTMVSYYVQPPESKGGPPSLEGLDF